jgi:hypothetical protein
MSWGNNQNHQKISNLGDHGIDGKIMKVRYTFDIKLLLAYINKNPFKYWADEEYLIPLSSELKQRSNKVTISCGLTFSCSSSSQIRVWLSGALSGSSGPVASVSASSPVSSGSDTERRTPWRSRTVAHCTLCKPMSSPFSPPTYVSSSWWKDKNQLCLNC